MARRPDPRPRNPRRERDPRRRGDGTYRKYWGPPTTLAVRVNEMITDQLLDRMDEAAIQGHSIAQEVVPYRTGALYRSIWTRVDEVKMTIYIGATKYYAGYVEYGTAWMPPRPYLRVGQAEIQRYMGG